MTCKLMLNPPFDPFRPITAEALSAELIALQTFNRSLVDELDQVMQLLREEGQYTLSDRLRVLIGRLARTVPAGDEARNVPKGAKLVVTMARTYKDYS